MSKHACVVYWLCIQMLLYATACQKHQQAAIQSANDLFYNKQYAEAERLYRRTLRQLDSDRDDANRAFLLNRLGTINSLYLRDYKQALIDYENLLQRYPASPEALPAAMALADLYHYKVGNLPLAIATYEHFIATYPNDAAAKQADVSLVKAYISIKDYKQARLHYETLVGRNPGTPEALEAGFDIASTYVLEKHFDDAIATYQKLLDTNSDRYIRALVLFEMGNCYQEMGATSDALQSYYSCLAVHPNPKLIQRKIQRLRARLHRTAPSDNILNGQRLVKNTRRLPRLKQTSQAAEGTLATQAAP